MPSLSVVVPVYNVEDYLDRCFESLEAQSTDDFEIICVNDGSTDSSPKKLDEWARKDAKVRVINQKNSGLSAARNAGIEAAVGDYICFLDSDDRFFPNACADIIRYMSESDIDVLTFGAIYVPEREGSPWLYWDLSPRNITYNTFDINLLMREPSRPFAWRIAVRKDFINENNLRFDESVRFGEDQIFCFAIYPRAKGVRLTSRKLYEYRLGRSGSLMDTVNQDIHGKMLKHITIIDHIYTDWDQQGLLHQYASQMISWAMDFALSEMVKVPQDDFADVCNHFSALLRKYVSESEIQAVEIPEDRRFALDLYKRTSQNLLRRKRSAQEFYQVRNKTKPIWRWVASSWYLPIEDA